jgi:hypothetical protein
MHDARFHQGLETPGYPEKIVPEGTTPPLCPLQGSVFFMVARDFNPWRTAPQRQQATPGVPPG